jgi:hypothetical protein
MHVYKKIDLVKTLGSDGNIHLNNKILENEQQLKEMESKLMKKLKKL